MAQNNAGLRAGPQALGCHSPFPHLTQVGLFGRLFRNNYSSKMVGRLLEPGPVSVAWADVSVEDDRRSMASVASTAGTGFISLAHRMAALALDFSDKLEDGEPGGLSESRSARAGLHSLHQRRVDEEDDEDDGTRSERTVNTAVTGDDVEPAGEQEEPMGVGRRRSSLLGGGIDTPDHQHAPRLPFQARSMRPSALMHDEHGMHMARALLEKG